MTRGKPPTQAEVVSKLNLWWYPAALIPILIVFALAVTEIIPPIIAMPTMLLLVFWALSFIFAVALKLWQLWKPRS
jgi:hypothetical protein